LNFGGWRRAFPHFSFSVFTMEVAMSRNPRILAIAVVFAGTGALFGAAPAYATNTAYYVDATNGSDGNAGTSAAAAWQTLAKVNATTFTQGDRILLRAGQKWVGQIVAKGSGVLGNPITIGAYGDGPRPIIDGGTLTNGGGAGTAAVLLKNVSYWTVTGLEVTNTDGTNNYGTIAHPGTNRNGIMAYNTSGTGKHGITIIDNYVHDVNGCSACTGANPQTNGGIAVLADVMNGLNNGASSWGEIQILDNVVENVGRTGIVFNDYSTGFLYSVSADALSRNVTVSGNKLKNIDSDGIIVSGSINNLIEHNRVDTAGLVTVSGSTEPGTVGMFVAKSKDSLIQFNEVSGVRYHVVDGEAYDVDLLSYGAIVQYNYSHDNEGGMILLMGGTFSGNNAIVRYNLSVNDAFLTNGVFTLASGLMSGVNIYNNTVYIAPGLTSRAISQEGWSGGNNNTWFFRNNVIVNLGSGTWQVPTGSGTTISHNLIYGNHTAGEPADAFKITADPQMISPSTIAPEGLSMVAGYGVERSSPAIGTGIPIIDNGGRDYFGNLVSSAVPPTLGFHQPN
jgi:parallel beta-helix repeat protein